MSSSLRNVLEMPRAKPKEAQGSNTCPFLVTPQGPKALQALSSISGLGVRVRLHFATQRSPGPDLHDSSDQLLPAPACAYSSRPPCYFVRGSDLET